MLTEAYLSGYFEGYVKEATGKGSWAGRKTKPTKGPTKQKAHTTA